MSAGPWHRSLIICTWVSWLLLWSNIIKYGWRTLHWSLRNVSIFGMWLCKLRICCIRLVSLTSKIWRLWRYTWICSIWSVSRISMIRSATSHLNLNRVHNLWLLCLLLLIPHWADTILRFDKSILIFFGYISFRLWLCLCCHWFDWMHITPRHHRWFHTRILILHNLVWVWNMALSI